MTERKSGSNRRPKPAALSYFARPGDGGVLREPIPSVRSAWYGPDLSPEEWRTELTPEQDKKLAEVVQASFLRISTSNKSLQNVTMADLPLPSFMEPIVKKCKEELSGVHGLGFHVIRGISAVSTWSKEEQEFFFWALGQHLGAPNAQDEDGLLLQRVTDTGENHSSTRLYKTNAAIDFHCDAADAVGLLCLQQGMSGGISRIVSSVTVYNEFLKRHGLAMAKRLYKPFPMDLRSKKISYVPLTPVRYSGDGQLRTFYMSDYFRSAYRHADAPDRMPPYDKRVLDAYQSVATDPKLYLDMEFQIGDIQLVSNHVVLHARTAYRDGPPAANGEPQRKRDLLRLWLTLDRNPSETWRQRISIFVDKIGLTLKIIWSKIRFKIWGRPCKADDTDRSTTTNAKVVYSAQTSSEAERKNQ